jgi:hypothetical protein
VEQNRASHVLPHHRELARPTARDENAYTSGIKVSDEELASLTIERDAFHGEWNYRLIPRDNDK